MRQMVTRRGFIGAGVALAAAGCASSAAQGAAERDEKLARFRNAAESTLGWAKEEQPLP